MKRYWIIRNGLLQHSQPLTDLKQAQGKIKDLYKANKKATPQQFEIVEEHISYRHLSTVTVAPHIYQLAEVSGPPKGRLGECVPLMLPRHTACESIPYELKEQLDAILAAKFSRKLGGAKAGDMF